ncbi:hypothetical protein ACWC2K_12225 [Streptomyces chattanoogensis]|uniref:hypothetical protein n=1 Tax=Streptomyces chattanoogensis TaxID=66876 RepID=UPI0036C86F64
MACGIAEPGRTLAPDADVTDEAVWAWARDLDLLTGRPDLFLCGVDLVDGAPRPVFEHFVERRFFRTLTARLSG